MKGAIFDLDGTLLDSMGHWAGVAGNFLKTRNIEVDKETIRVLEEQPLYKSAEYIKEKYVFSESTDEISIKMFGVMEYNYKHKIEFKQGALEFLNKLKEKGVKMCVATATDSNYAQSALERLGVWEMFEFLLTCGDVNSGKKESALIYEEALKKMGTSKEDTVVFEDAPHAVSTAKNAGFYVVGVYDDYFEKHKEEISKTADKYIYSFDEMEI